MSTSSNVAPSLKRGGFGGVSLRQLYVGRAAFAIVWAVAFVAVDKHFNSGTKVLLVVYPSIDVVASLVDARSQRGLGSAAVQFLNAALSTVALIALAIAVGHDKATVLHVFGAWAIISGLIQLMVAVRRRSELGRQTAMLTSGAVSTIAGIVINAMATSTNPKLAILGGYAALGAILFLVSASRLERRRSGV